MSVSYISFKLKFNNIILLLYCYLYRYVLHICIVPLTIVCNAYIHVHVRVLFGTLLIRTLKFKLSIYYYSLYVYIVNVELYSLWHVVGVIILKYVKNGLK